MLTEHRAHEYVRGDVHTNTIESAFGLFKRAVIGSFRQVSVKHRDRYLDEFEFRYNNRKNKYLFRDTLTNLMNGRRAAIRQAHGLRAFFSDSLLMRLASWTAFVPMKSALSHTSINSFEPSIIMSSAAMYFSHSRVSTLVWA